MKIVKKIIQAIKQMNTDDLNRLLDDDKTYMDVYKDAFVNKLAEKFEDLKEKGITCFDSINEGSCNKCQKGQTGYRFMAKDGPYIDFLFILDAQGELSDMYTCSDMCCDQSVDDRTSIHLQFDQDDVPGFLESTEYLIKKQKIDQAMAACQDMIGILVTLEEIEEWVYRHEGLLSGISERAINPIRAFIPFDNLIINLQFLLTIKDYIDIGQKALNELDACHDDITLIEAWVEKYNDHPIFSNVYPSDYSEELGILYFKNSIDLVIDCSPYMAALKFEQLYLRELLDVKFKDEEPMQGGYYDS